VALGRAIVRQPRGFLMDEPLSNLDAQLRVQMRREIIRLQRQLGITTIYVTHDQVEAMTMGDRIVVMRDGIMQQVGKPDELYRRPRNTFVARFIGSPAMNMDEGELVSREGRFLLQTKSAAIVLPDALRDATRRAGSGDGNAKVVWGVRPEDLVVSTDDSVGSDGLRGVVDLVEHLGADSYASVSVAGDLYVARVSPDVRLEENQPVGLSFNPAKLHLFSHASGDSLLAP
jgi:multiple sugar transport system ATP-binding protein